MNHFLNFLSHILDKILTKRAKKSIYLPGGIYHTIDEINISECILHKIY